MTAHPVYEYVFPSDYAEQGKHTKVAPAQLDTAGGLADNLIWRCRRGR